MSYAIDLLLKERQSVSEEVTALNARLREAREKIRELDESIAQLGGQELVESLAAPRRNSGGITLRDLVLAQLPAQGAAKGPSPNEIAKILTDSGRETTNTSVSATLSRMKNEEGVAIKIDGQWFRIDAGAGNAAAQKESAPFGADNEGNDFV